MHWSHLFSRCVCLEAERGGCASAGWQWFRNQSLRVAIVDLATPQVDQPRCSSPATPVPFAWSWDLVCSMGGCVSTRYTCAAACQYCGARHSKCQDKCLQNRCSPWTHRYSSPQISRSESAPPQMKLGVDRPDTSHCSSESVPPRKYPSVSLNVKMDAVAVLEGSSSLPGPNLLTPPRPTPFTETLKPCPLQCLAVHAFSPPSRQCRQEPNKPGVHKYIWLK